MRLPWHLCLNPRMFWEPRLVTAPCSSFVSLEQLGVKIAFPKSAPKICALKDGPLKEKAIIKKKPASYGPDFIMFSCCYFHHRLFYIPHFFSFFFSPPSSCSLRSHLFGAHNDFYDNFAEKGSTWMQRELQWDRNVSGGTSLLPETFSQVQLRCSADQEKPDLRSGCKTPQNHWWQSFHLQNAMNLPSIENQPPWRWRRWSKEK